MRYMRGAGFYISFLYITVYIPLAFMIYLPYWYELNCGWHGRCEMIGIEDARTAISELTMYFQHRGDLVSGWTVKERLHLEEVRGMFDNMFAAFMVSLILLTFTFDASKLPRFALLNSVVVLSVLLVVPFFGYFWADIFHPLLFDNELWRNTMNDVSFYIMPRRFFMYSTVMLVLSVCLINLGVWRLSGKRNDKK